MENKDEKLKEWIKNLPEEKKADLLFELIERMIDIEEIRFNPKDGEDVAPYWEASGDELGEYEE